MGTPTNFNDTTPAAPSGYQNVKFQKDSSVSPNLASAYVPNIGGASKKIANYPIVAADDGTMIVLNGTSLTATLPAAAPSAKFRVWVVNIAVTNATVARNGHNINGAASNLTLAQNQGCYIATDGTDWYAEEGLGSGGGSGSLAGLSDVTITSIADKDIIAYKTADGKYENQSIATLGLQLAATAFLKDGSVTATGDFNMGSHKLTSVTDPASAQDAATKNYVDLATGGGGGAGRTLKYNQDNTSLTGWTTGGTGTTPTHVTNLLGATDVIKVPNNSFIQRNLGGVITNFNNAVIEFDIAAYNPTSALFDVLFGMDSSGNGGVSLRLDDRGSGAGQQMGLGGTSSVFKSTGTVDSTSIFVTTNAEMATRFHHFKIVISSDGSHASWYWNGAAQQISRAISMAGAYIGVYGEAGSNGCIIMNLTVSQ